LLPDLETVLFSTEIVLGFYKYPVFWGILDSHGSLPPCVSHTRIILVACYQNQKGTFASINLMFMVPYILVIHIFDCKSDEMHTDFYVFLITLNFLYMYRVLFASIISSANCRISHNLLQWTVQLPTHRNNHRYLRLYSTVCAADYG
jgi:hypothetical protein